MDRVPPIPSRPDSVRNPTLQKPPNLKLGPPASSKASRPVVHRPPPARRNMHKKPQPPVQEQPVKLDAAAASQNNKNRKLEINIVGARPMIEVGFRNEKPSVPYSATVPQPLSSVESLDSQPTPRPRPVPSPRLKRQPNKIRESAEAFTSPTESENNTTLLSQLSQRAEKDDDGLARVDGEKVETPSLASLRPKRPTIIRAMRLSEVKKSEDSKSMEAEPAACALSGTASNAAKFSQVLSTEKVATSMNVLVQPVRNSKCSVKSTSKSPNSFIESPSRQDTTQKHNSCKLSCPSKGNTASVVLCEGEDNSEKSDTKNITSPLDSNNIPCFKPKISRKSPSLRKVEAVSADGKELTDEKMILGKQSKLEEKPIVSESKPLFGYCEEDVSKDSNGINVPLRKPSVPAKRSVSVVTIADLKRAGKIHPMMPAKPLPRPRSAKLSLQKNFKNSVQSKSISAAQENSEQIIKTKQELPKTVNTNRSEKMKSDVPDKSHVGFFKRPPLPSKRPAIVGAAESSAIDKEKIGELKQARKTPMLTNSEKQKQPMPDTEDVGSKLHQFITTTVDTDEAELRKKLPKKPPLPTRPLSLLTIAGKTRTKKLVLMQEAAKQSFLSQEPVAESSSEKICMYNKEMENSLDNVKPLLHDDPIKKLERNNTGFSDDVHRRYSHSPPLELSTCLPTENYELKTKRMPSVSLPCRPPPLTKQSFQPSFLTTSLLPLDAETKLPQEDADLVTMSSKETSKFKTEKEEKEEITVSPSIFEKSEIIGEEPQVSEGPILDAGNSVLHQKEALEISQQNSTAGNGVAFASKSTNMEVKASPDGESMDESLEESKNGALLLTGSIASSVDAEKLLLKTVRQAVSSETDHEEKPRKPGPPRPLSLPCRSLLSPAATQSILPSHAKSPARPKQSPVFKSRFFESTQRKSPAGVSAANTPRTALQPVGKDLQGPRGMAMFNYTAVESDELSFKAGDMITLIRRIDQSWLLGSCGDAEGILPQDFIRVLEPLHEPVGMATDADFVSEIPEPSMGQSRKANEVVAAFEFQGGDGELSFQPGDQIEILGRVSNDWLFGSWNNKEGYFPAAFVDNVPDSLLLSIASSESKKENLQPIQASNESPSKQNENQSKPMNGAEEKSKYCYACFSFEAQHDDELSFLEGDTIEILEWTDTDWLKGRLNGKEGIFPIDFVKMLDAGLQETSSHHGKKSESVIALYDFQGQNEDELTFKAGEIIFLKGKNVGDSSEWFLGEVAGKEGMFPASFVQPQPSPV